MLFLTDGRATNGEKDDNKLLETVKLINSSANINCVAFGKVAINLKAIWVAIYELIFKGDDADYTFLKKLASQTGGLARKIYPDSDAALQIKGFRSSSE